MYWQVTESSRVVQHVTLKHCRLKLAAGSGVRTGRPRGRAHSLRQAPQGAKVCLQGSQGQEISPAASQAPQLLCGADLPIGQGCPAQGHQPLRLS